MTPKFKQPASIQSHRRRKKPWDTPVGGNRVPESVASSLLHPATLRAPDVHGKSAPFRA